MTSKRLLTDEEYDEGARWCGMTSKPKPYAESRLKIEYECPRCFGKGVKRGNTCPMCWGHGAVSVHTWEWYDRNRQRSVTEKIVRWFRSEFDMIVWYYRFQKVRK